MGDDFTCNIDGVGIVLIKIFDRIVRELKDVRYIPQMKKTYLNWSFRGTGFRVLW